MGVQSSNASYYIHNGVNTEGFPLNTNKKIRAFSTSLANALICFHNKENS